MAKKAKRAAAEEVLGRNEKKWGKSVMSAGWTAVPSILLEKQHALSLTPTDVNVLLQLWRFWWQADDPPYPSKTTIARAMDVSPRTVQRRITSMEKLGFIKRTKRRGPYGTNAITFSGLREKLEPFAKEKIDQSQTKRRQREEPQRRKRPGLRVAK